MKCWRFSWRVAMRKCPKCNSWRAQKVERVTRSYRCPNCGWIEISYIELGLYSSPSRQLQGHLRRYSWIYAIFFFVILGGSYFITTIVITPAKYFAFQDEVSLFSTKNETAGAIKSTSVTTEATVIVAPLTQVAPNVPAVSRADAESVSQQQPEKFDVVANSDSKLYHLPGMKYYNRISSHHRVIFTSEEAARQAGYRKAPR
jgi:hypothetical protein